ncbi:hypothetical protein ECG_07190 [Echinococcus granulosus]|nr:hypothetical protein ECG_07190 [Echinococcus granulosus]
MFTNKKCGGIGECKHSYPVHDANNVVVGRNRAITECHSVPVCEQLSNALSTICEKYLPTSPTLETAYTEMNLPPLLETVKYFLIYIFILFKRKITT